MKDFQILHQTGIKNFSTTSGQAEVALTDDKYKSRYLAFPYLNPLQMKMAAGAATIIISRAGSTIFQIASWGVPSILIPFANSNAEHSRKNAFNYARAGACSVIEEANMTANILSSEIERILNDKTGYGQMTQNAKVFSHPGAAEKIARELVDIALSHEK
jgi:UDP-N-acetylglucosamine--N-acetylmuramyl-(pentapeptide) pyrophosphoryl-undecaprenol N-acetylglucosamine transferase